MIAIEVDTGGTVERMEILAKSFRDLRPVFAQFAKWLREDVQRVFDSEGDGQWPKRKGELSQTRIAANVERIEANKYRSLQSSLRSSRKKAERRLLKTTDSKLITRRQKSVQRYEEQLAEVAKLASGGERSEGQKRLYDRVARRDALAQKRIADVKEGKLLAGIASSLRTDTEPTFFEMYSRIPWAGVHNFGGTGGKGANEPERKFLEWTPKRLRMFVEMANAYFTGKARKRLGYK